MMIVQNISLEQKLI